MITVIGVLSLFDATLSDVVPTKLFPPSGKFPFIPKGQFALNPIGVWALLREPAYPINQTKTKIS